MFLHGYKTYGLLVKSELELPELIPSEVVEHDVLITYGKVPESLTHSREKGVLYEAAKDEFILRMKGVGAFHVSKGKTICVESAEGGSAELLRVFLLGSAFGALLHQRDILALHGSAVSLGEKALVITGSSASGKSTLAASLSGGGYPLMADDISAIEKGPETYTLHPGIPRLKLWNDALRKLQMGEEGLEQIRPSVEKYSKNMAAAFESKSKPVSAIIVLHPWNQQEISIEEIKGMNKFEELNTQTYRHQFVHGLEKSGEHFSLVTGLANSARVFRVNRPSSPLLIEELHKKVVKEIISRI